MNQVRIISGIYGGRLINTPKSKSTHPMGDREKQAIFNQIRHHLAETRVLDAFAGSGALGIEALSEGAEFAVFLEKDRKAILTILSNLEKFNIDSSQALVVPSIAGSSELQPFDIIFADPPYDNPQYTKITTIVDMLASGGIFILSHPSELPPPSFPKLHLLSDRSYARAQIKIYQANF